MDEEIEIIFDPKEDMDESVQDKIMKGVMTLREKSPKFYLDNSTFALVIDSTEKTAPISMINKEIGCSRMILNFKVK